MYLFMDTETGGLKPTSPMLSIAFILTDDSNFELGRLVVKTKPSVDPIIQVEAMAVNKIDLIKHWKEAVSYAEAKNHILDWLISFGVNKTNTILVGHNIPFDLAFIETYLMEEKLLRTYFNKYKEDTGIIASFLGYNFYNLGNLAEVLEVDISDLTAHTEIGDTEITRRCYFKMKAQIFGG